MDYDKKMQSTQQAVDKIFKALEEKRKTVYANSAKVQQQYIEVKRRELIVQMKEEYLGIDSGDAYELGVLLSRILATAIIRVMGEYHGHNARKVNINGGDEFPFNWRSTSDKIVARMRMPSAITTLIHNLLDPSIAKEDMKRLLVSWANNNKLHYVATVDWLENVGEKEDVGD